MAELNYLRRRARLITLVAGGRYWADATDPAGATGNQRPAAPLRFLRAAEKPALQQAHRQALNLIQHPPTGDEPLRGTLL